jgi:CBS domain-containing protein
MAIMTERDIGLLVVIDGEKVVGIISERDLARNIILKEMASKEISVQDLMTKEIYCITPDKSVEECMGVMTTAHIRHMPVFDNNKLSGVVTFADITKALLMEQKIKIEDLESYSSCTNEMSYED